MGFAEDLSPWFSLDGAQAAALSTRDSQTNHAVWFVGTLAGR